MNNYYIRFKDIPPNEISGIYDGDLGKVGEESGVSCYEIVEVEGYFKIIVSAISLGFFYDLLGFISSFENSEIPAYLIKAEKVGIGTYGEPVVKNIEIIKKLQIVELATHNLNKPKSKLDKTNKQLC